MYDEQRRSTEQLRALLSTASRSQPLPTRMCWWAAFVCSRLESAALKTGDRFMRRVRKGHPAYLHGGERVMEPSLNEGFDKLARSASEWDKRGASDQV